MLNWLQNILIKGMTTAGTLIYFSSSSELMQKVAQAYDSEVQGLGGFFSMCPDRTLNVSAFQGHGERAALILSSSLVLGLRGETNCIKLSK